MEVLERRCLLAGSAPTLVRPIPDLTVQAEVPFQFDARPNGSVTLGFDVGGAHARVTDNVFAGSMTFNQSWEDVTFTGNTIINQAPNRVLSINDSGGLDFVWDLNAYVTNGASPFGFHDGSKTFDQWKRSTGLDDNSLLTDGIVGTEVQVRPNLYQPGRGHVVVYNWDRAEKVQVDLRSVIQLGAEFQVYNVLDLQGEPVVRGVHDGSPVTIPLGARMAPVPIGHVPAAPLLMDNEFATFLVLSAADPEPIQGRRWFVATNGSALGNGSESQPWDLQTAMSQPSGVRPGDTIWLRGGTYVGAFDSNLQGTAAAPIRVRSYPGERAVVDLNTGSPNHYPLISIEGQYTHFEDFEIFSSSRASRTTAQPGSWPADINRGNININGDHIKLINMEIHDLNKGLGFWSQASGGEVYGSLIYNNGWIGPDRRHGHAIYSQNAGDLRRFSDNITFNQFRNGIKVYGSSAASLDNHHLEGNVSFNNGAAEGIGFTGNYQILIGGGRPAHNISLHENYTYVSSHHFEDSQTSQALIYTARQADGSPLPGWLSFYGDEGYFVGTPGATDIGTINIEMTAHNRQGASVTETFRLEVQPRNRAPLPGQPIPDQSFHRNEPFEFDVASAFIDPDQADELTYSIASNQGGPLPQWIQIESDTGRIHGLSSEAGTLDLEIFAFDQQGKFTSQTFSLTIDSTSVPLLEDLILQASGQLWLSLDPTGETIQIRHHNQVVASRPLDQTSRIDLRGLENSSDTLTVDFSHGNPIPDGGLDWTGGDDSEIDRLVLRSGAFDTLQLDLANGSEPGLLQLHAESGSTEIRLKDRGRIESMVQSDHSSIGFSGQRNVVQLSSIDTNHVHLVGDHILPLTLQAPSQSLTVRGDRQTDAIWIKDRFAVAGVDLHLQASVVATQGSIDTRGGSIQVISGLFGVALESVIQTGGGGIDLSSEWVLLAGSIYTSGGKFASRGGDSFLAWSSTATIDTRGSRRDGNLSIDYGQSVVLQTVLTGGGQVDIDAGKTLSFRGDRVDTVFASLGSER